MMSYTGCESNPLFLQFAEVEKNIEDDKYRFSSKPAGEPKLTYST